MKYIVFLYRNASAFHVGEKPYNMLREVVIVGFIPRNKTVAELFKELTGMIEFPEYYKRLEEELQEDDENERIALDFGFVFDNYYTAKGNMEVQNILHTHINTGTVGSFGHGPMGY